MDEMTKRAQIMIRVLTKAGFLPESLPADRYLELWDAMKEGLAESDRQTGKE